MSIWMFFSIIALVSSNDVNNTEFCDTCVNVNKTCFNVTYLFDIEAPYRDKIVITKLGVLRSSNTLFYSFEPKIADNEYNKVGFINLDNPANTSIIYSDKQLLNFGTFDLDQDNGMVYLGGSDGVYMLDTKLNRVSPYSSRGDTVLSIFYKGHVYFIRDGEFKIVKKKGDNFDILLEYMVIKNFVINKYNVIVFLSTYGLFANKREETVWLSNNAFFRGLTINLDDVIYAWWIDGIYKIHIDAKLANSKITKVAQLPGVGALTFDNDNNMLFTSGKSLYKLIETNTTLC